MTELGKIPEDWDCNTISSICEIIMGQSPLGESYNDSGEGEPLLNGPTEFGKRYPTAKQWTVKPTKMCLPGDVLFCVRGSSTGRMNFSNGSYCIGRGLAAIRGKHKGQTNFIYYSLQYNLNSVLSLSAGSTFPNVTRDDLNNLKICLPPVDEQQKIADILSTVDEQIEQTDALIEKTQQLKKGLVQRLLTKGIGHTEFKQTEVGKIPVTWVISRIDKICNVRTEKFNPVATKNQAYLGLEHFEQATGRILGIGSSIDTTSTKTVFKKGDTLFGKLRPYLRKYWIAEFDGVCATEILPLVPLKGVSENYLFYVIQQDKFIDYTVQGSFGTKMPRTSWNEIRQYMFPLPPIKEQLEIASFLSKVDEQVYNLVTSKSKLLSLKQALMQLLLTGRIRVTVN